MYLEYWGFGEFPFENVPDPRFFYLSKSHEEALTRLIYAARNRMREDDTDQGICPTALR